MAVLETPGPGHKPRPLNLREVFALTRRGVAEIVLVDQAAAHRQQLANRDPVAVGDQPQQPSGNRIDEAELPSLAPALASQMRAYSRGRNDPPTKLQLDLDGNVFVLSRRFFADPGMHGEER